MFQIIYNLFQAWYISFEIIKLNKSVLLKSQSQQNLRDLWYNKVK